MLERINSKELHIYYIYSSMTNFASPLLFLFRQLAFPLVASRQKLVLKRVPNSRPEGDSPSAESGTFSLIKSDRQISLGFCKYAHDGRSLDVQVHVHRGH